MTVKDLERLYDYGYWANKKLLGVVSQLTPEQFTHTVAGSYGSVQAGLLCDSRQHRGANALIVVECEDKVWPSLARESPMRTRLSFDLPL